MSDDAPEADRTRLSADVKWLIGVIMAMALPIAGFLMKTSLDIGSLKVSAESSQDDIKTLSQSIDRVSDAISTIVTSDVMSLKERLTRLESLRILPDAERRLTELEKRLRAVESKQ